MQCRAYASICHIQALIPSPEYCYSKICMLRISRQSYRTTQSKVRSSVKLRKPRNSADISRRNCGIAKIKAWKFDRLVKALESWLEDTRAVEYWSVWQVSELWSGWMDFRAGQSDGLEMDHRLSIFMVYAYVARGRGHHYPERVCSKKKISKMWFFSCVWFLARLARSFSESQLHFYRQCYLPVGRGWDQSSCLWP